MNIFKKIVLINKIKKRIKEAKKLVDRNKGLANKVKKVIENLKNDINEFVSLLPMFNGIKEEIIELFKDLV